MPSEPSIARFDPAADGVLIGDDLVPGYRVRVRDLADGPVTVAPRPAWTVLVLGLSGRIHLSDGTRLGRFDARRLPLYDPVTLAGDGRCLVLTYRRVNGTTRDDGPSRARFATMRPLRTRIPIRFVPRAVYDLLSPRDLYPLLGPVTRGPGRFLIPGPDGWLVVLATTPKGTGPALHVHTRSTEMFVVLEGRFEVSWGDHGESAVELGPLDRVVFPPGHARAFTALADGENWILPMVVGANDEREDIAWPAPVVEQLREAGPPGMVRLMRAAGFQLTRR